MAMRNVKRFILLGDAGAGKSTFINFLYNFYYGSTNPDEILCEHPHIRLAIPCANWLDCLDKKYRENKSERDINDQTQSQTQFCTSYLLKSNKINLELELIDTPGFNDTNGVQADENNLDQIEKALQSIPYINGIILVVNGTMVRTGVSFDNFLHLLQQVWPNDLLNNCIAILTNCDEVSMNFDKSILKNGFNVEENCRFTFQNNLFRWNRKMESSKTIRSYKQNFEDNVQKVDILLEKLATYKEVSTQSFKISAIKIGLIEKSIIQSVRNMIHLVKCYKERNIAHDAIEGAQTTMNDNRNWGKKQEIQAILWEDIAGNQALPSLSLPREPPKHATKTHSFHNETFVQPPSRYDNSHQTSSSRQMKGGGGHEKTECISGAGRSDYMDCDTSNYKTTRETHSFDSNQLNRKSTTSDGNKNSYNRGAMNDSYGQQNAHHPTSSIDSRHQSVHRQTVSTNPSYEPAYRPKQAVIEINLPDNEARMRYAEAERQAAMLKKRTKELEDEQQTLSIKIKSQLHNIQQKVSELWQINRNYDVLQRNKDLLEEFAQIVKFWGDHSEMKTYYAETVNILTKPTHDTSHPSQQKSKQ